MSLVNICRDNHDPFYRYKMPLLQIKKEGRGNGVRTSIENIEEVARALARPVNYVIKYFGFELGTQTAIDAKNERYLINGHHEANDLQDILDGFINKFVLCLACKNPETVLEISKDDVKRDCKACGKITMVDPRLKLTGFIIKNKPKKTKKVKTATASENVVGGGKSISDIASKQTAVTGGSQDADADASASSSATPAQPLVVNDDDWAVDMSEEAIKSRASNFQSSASTTGKYTEFGKWILQQEEFPNAVEIYKKATDLDIAQDRQVLEVLPQVLFTDEIIEEIDEFKPLLIKLITSDKHEKSLLGGIERFIALQEPQLKSQVPKILMKLYDEDLVSENVIKQWATHVSKKYIEKEQSRSVRKEARPFIKWLNEADEESEEESE
ncbi:translation initiation factor eIF5 [Martiniozyma asiatica (nom. inval.)]|nr:translation initiation factor eIF5 [Martiniozyma asiatica]